MFGYIKLYRKLINWGWYSDSVVKDVFIHFLLTANHKTTKFMGNEIKPGESVFSYEKLATVLGFSVQQIRTAIKKLISTGEIVVKSTNKFSIVNVVNWGLYQPFDYDEQQTNNKRITNEQQTNNKQITTLNNDKNDKNDNNIYNTRTRECEVIHTNSGDKFYKHKCGHYIFRGMTFCSYCLQKIDWSVINE